MKKQLLLLFILIINAQSLDFWGVLPFGGGSETKADETLKVKSSSSFNINAVSIYFEPKRAEFSAPRCLRNIADIIEEIEKLQLTLSFDASVEIVVQKTARYSEMLFSCGFAFQYQAFFKLFNMYSNYSAASQGSCGEKSHSCGGEMNISLESNEGSEEKSFYKKILPCATKIKEIYGFYFENSAKVNFNHVEEFKNLVLSIQHTEECAFSVFSSFIEGTKPCVLSFNKVAEIYHQIHQSTSITLGIVSQGPSLFYAITEMLSVCKNTAVDIVYPAIQNNNN